MKRHLYYLCIVMAAFGACDEKTIYDAPVCGNGVLEAGEKCDDGNLTSGDGCSALCITEYTELCDNIIDDDGDGLIDCADPDCFGESLCDGEICNNGIDDNDDGLTDCADPGCRVTPHCAGSEVCDNGWDDDQNGDVDCDDTACTLHPVCGACDADLTLDGVAPGRLEPLAPTAFTTSVSLPCDVEGRAFYEVELVVVSAVSLTLSATSLASEDLVFGFTKMEDPGVTCDLDQRGCLLFSGGAQVSHYLPLVTPGTYRLFLSEGFPEVTLTFGAGVLEECDNGLDDDEDGLVDCEDPQCDAELHCLVEVCDNGLDDDQDGHADCDDTDCALFCAPDEVCDNGLDDDLDGHADCTDFECVGSPTCEGSACISHGWLGSLSRGSLVRAPFDTGLTPNSYSTSCGGIGADYTLSFELESPSHLFVHMTQTGAHSLALASQAGDGSICTDGELACFPAGGIHMPISATFNNLQPGTYYLLMDAVSVDATGSGEVEVQVVGLDDEICLNGIDDDSDGAVDCDDTDCAAVALCGGEALCHDDTDDDGDGWVDCTDSDCIGDLSCGSGNCLPYRDLGTLSTAAPLAAMVDLAAGTEEMTQACGAQIPVMGSVLSFSLAQEGRVRVRTIPVGFTEPVTSLAFPAGPGTSCEMGEHLCSVVPAPGLANTVITQVTLPAGGPYYILVAPYFAPATGEAQIILYLDP